ncbi:hypothetical protein [Lachnoclostridium sp. An14]|nr:hypothetical protein [Lachnoclostridium sp. An14]
MIWGGFGGMCFWGILFWEMGFGKELERDSSGVVEEMWIGFENGLRIRE